jgi:hypothetical protein
MGSPERAGATGRFVGTDTGIAPGCAHARTMIPGRGTAGAMPIATADVHGEAHNAFRSDGAVSRGRREARGTLPCKGILAGCSAVSTSNSYEDSLCQETNYSYERTVLIFFRFPGPGAVDSRSRVLTCFPCAVPARRGCTKHVLRFRRHLRDECREPVGLSSAT